MVSEGGEYGSKSSHPNPIPSNPQHNPERPTRPKEPDPTTNGLRGGESETGESEGREKTQPRKEEPDPFKCLSDFISKDGLGGG